VNARSRWRPAILAALLALAGGVGLISARSVSDQLAILTACEAVEAEDWETVLEKTAGRVGGSDSGRAATECRCMALLATGAGDACIALLESAVAQGRAEGWTPGPALAVHLIQSWRDRARARDAAELAHRAALRHPNDPDLFYLELETRSGIEDDAAVLRELSARAPDRGPHAVRMRVSLANRHLFRGDPESALAALGNRPPDEAGAATGLWFDTRGMALAAGDDIDAVIHNYEAWRRAGGDPGELAARYALTLSIAGLADPKSPPSELLRNALAAGDRLKDPKLHEALAIRLILTLANEGNVDEALAVYDRAHRTFEMSGLSREELERSGAHRRLADAPDERRRGDLRFDVRDPRPGSALLLSPEADAPVDTPFVSLPVPASGQIEATRAIGTAPLRWVYRDAEQRTLASGTANPAAGRVVDVRIEPREPREPQRTRLTRRPADGRRRVVLLLLDCGDWRIVEYLRARGELPTLNGLIRNGHRAVLDSDPPFTAAALEALVWPNRRGAASFVGLVHRFGVELAGLASVGENPFEGLGWVLPEDRDLFSVLGAGRHAVANLLLGHGSIRAGKHSEVTGPFGRKRRIPLTQSARDLHADERERWPTLAGKLVGHDAVHIRTIAAEFDTAEEIVDAREVDLLALRIEPLDILTHAHFAATVRDGQDDGEKLLYDVYRYVDARIAGVHERIDTDDVFIVMSDHGIRTAMEHSRDGIFIATGPGIPRGRVPGRPALRGVSAVLADVLGVRTDWPETGLAFADAPPLRKAESAIPRPRRRGRESPPGTCGSCAAGTSPRSGTSR
jgi:hypothetical protein